MPDWQRRHFAKAKKKGHPLGDPFVVSDEL